MNGSKFAAIAVVVLLAAAGLYYAFVAPPGAPSDTAPPSANGLGTTTARPSGATTPAPRTIGAAPSSNTTTPALRALGGAPSGLSNGTANASQVPATPAPTTLGANARGEQPGFTPGSLASAGTGKGDSVPANGVTSTPGAAAAATGANGFGNGFDAPVRGTAATGAPVASTPGGNNGSPAAVASKSGSPTPTGSGARPTTPPVATGSTESTHTVASGETMSSIAKRYFGSENKWTLVAKANPSIDPTSMKVGTKLRIPSQGAIAAANGGSGSTPKSPGTTPGATAAGGNHVIASGETLSSLSRQYYGSAKHWRKIYEANKSAIGSDPAALKVGQKLVIPSRTTVVGAENVDR